MCVDENNEEVGGQFQGTKVGWGQGCKHTFFGRMVPFNCHSQIAQRLKSAEILGATIFSVHFCRIFFWDLGSLRNPEDIVPEKLRDVKLNFVMLCTEQFGVCKQNVMISKRYRRDY